MGVFAQKKFRNGEKIYTYPQGKIVRQEEIDQLTETEKRHLDHIGEDRYEVIQPPACYINQSCEPNTEERDHVGHALRDIDSGEELAVDYNTVAYLAEPFTCHCGSANCRGIVKGKS